MFTHATPGGEVAVRAGRAEHKLLPHLSAVSKIVLACLALVACDEGAVGPEGAPAANALILTDAEVWIVSGDAQDVVVGASISEPLVALVIDANGNPIPGAPVTWSFASGHGRGGGSQVQSATVELMTDTDGRVSVEWEAGTTAGPQFAWASLPAAPAEVGTTAAPQGAPPEDRGNGDAVGNKGGGRQVAFKANAKPAPPTSIVVSPTSVSLQVGQTQALTAVLRDRHGNAVIDAVVAWTTTDRSVAEVNNNEVTAIGPGNADILASYADLSTAVSVSVSSPPVATEIVMSTTPLNLEVGQADTLTAVVLDQFGIVMPSAAIKWTSSNPAVATVGGGGVVVAVAPGNADIMASSGDLSDTVRVSVSNEPPSATEIVMSPTSLRLNVGQTSALTAVVLDQYGSEMSGAVLAWTSSDPSVTTVANDGTVVAVGVGNADVVASHNGLSGTVRATVQKAPSVASAIVASATSVTLAVGETLALTAVVLDQYGDEMFEAVVEWTSSDPAVATVASDGTLMGVAVGNIDVLASSGTLSDTVSAQIERAPPVPTAIVVSQTSLTLEVGETMVLTAVVLDQYGDVMPDAEVTWTSSDPSIVSVESGPAPAPGLSQAALPGKVPERNGLAQALQSDPLVADE